MKRYALIACAFFCASPLIASAADLETIEIMGDSYTVSKTLPPEILGTYNYEGKGAPIVEINQDGTGLFQPHGVPAIPIKVWIDVDDKGLPRRQVGTEQRYRYTLLIQYGTGGDGNYPAGKYDLMGITMLKDEGKAIILGERIRYLTK